MSVIAFSLFYAGCIEQVFSHNL